MMPREFKETRDAEFRTLHSPFEPADVLPGEPIIARVRLKSLAGVVADQTHLLPVWRISPFGVELVSDSLSRELTTGACLDLTLTISSQVSHFEGLVVEANAVVNGHSLVGLRWHRAPKSGPAWDERRDTERWTCSPEFYPTGVAANPARFNDFIHFRVRDISATGMRIVTSLRNKYLVPGMVLDTLISCPTIGQVTAQLEVVHMQVLEEEGRSYLALGTKFHGLTRYSAEIFGQYILQFGPPISLRTLQEAGLVGRSLSRAVDFGYVRTDQEYRKVLELRRMAYSRVGKMPEDIPLTDVGDINDTRARILIGQYRGDCVATMRLMFHNPGDPFEHEKHVVFPTDFPRRDLIIECTRACTHPDYRNGDLLFGLFRHGVVTALQSKRRWILSSATKSLLGLYKKGGAEVTSICYNPPELGGEDHFLFLIDVHRCMLGHGIGPVYWNLLYADVWQQFNVAEIIDVYPGSTLRISFYRLLRPFVELFAAWMKRPRKSEKGHG